jgi:sugar phosphate isomerase/epimerase
VPLFKPARLVFNPRMKSIARFLLVAVCLHSLALAAVAADGVGVGKSFQGPVGLQLYSLRAEFTRNVPAALDKVKSFGIRNVELAGTYNLSPEKFKEMLDARGFNPVSAHFPYERYVADPEAVARDAKTLGVKFAGCAWIPHEGAFDEKECRAAAAVFNKAGEALARQGIRFFYHAHGFEFQPHGDGTLLDLMMRETHPERVSFQMDVLWVVFPAQDPVKLLEKYKGRWVSMHLKDLKKGVATGSLSGKTDVTNDVVLGTGQMDWPAILAAAKKAGIQHYFIEDESPTAVEQIPQSLKYLEGVRFPGAAE